MARKKEEIKYDMTALRKARNKAKLIWEWVVAGTINYTTFEYIVNVTLKDDAIGKFMCDNPGLGQRW